MATIFFGHTFQSITDYAAAANLAAVTGHVEGDIAFVTGIGPFQYDNDSTATVDNTTVIASSDSVGRWLVMDVPYVHLNDNHQLSAEQVIAVGSVQADNGTAAAPSIAFASDTNIGVYRVGADNIGITAGGTLRFDISTTAITSTLPNLGAAGTAAAPNWSFSGDANTGIYSIGADNIGISTGGTLRFDVSTTAVTSTLPVLNAAGTAAAPSISFSGDANSGLYSIGADNVGVSTGGTLRFDVSTAAVTSTLPVVNAAGAAATPSVTFTGDLDTGLYHIGADNLGVSIGGTLRFDVSTTAVTSTLPVLNAAGSAAAPSVSFSGDSNSGMYSAGADQIGFGVNGAVAATLSASAFNVATGVAYQINGAQVVGAPVTGFVTMAGTANKDASGINADSITATDGNIQALAAYVKSVGDAIFTHGLTAAP